MISIGKLQRLMAVALLLVACGGVPATVRAQPPASPAQEGFVPIDQLGPKEELPAAPLVMAAYGVAWIVIFVYVLSIWRRLGRVEQEIAGVSQRVAGGGRR